MGARELNNAMDDLEVIIGDLVTRLESKGVDAETVHNLCGGYRQYGCGRLLGDLDAEGFHVALFQSARSYLWLLQQSTSPRDDYWLCPRRSRAPPLLDAIAINQLDLARTIGRSMKAPFSFAMEREPDYQYFTLLAGPLLDPKTPPDCLVDLTKSLDGESSIRAEVLQALVASKAPAFWSALRRLGSEWRDELAAQRSAGALPHAYTHTEAHVFIEGIALVRLAAARGMPKPKGSLRNIPAEVFAPFSDYPTDFTPLGAR